MQKSKLGYPYSYGDGDQLVPKISRSNRNKSKRLTILLLVLFLQIEITHAQPLFAEGFVPNNRCHCIPHYSRQITGLNARSKKNNKNRRKPERRYVEEFGGLIFEDRQTQEKYEHAPDFGIYQNYNPANARRFQDQILAHIRNPETIAIQGTFRKHIDVTHYVNKKTGLNAFFHRNTKEFISGWLLTDGQFAGILEKGTLY